MGALAGKCALVTGGTKGLGAELALGLARAGADVAVLGRDGQAGEAVCRQIGAIGRRNLAIQADVMDQEQMDAAATQVRAAFGAVDILVCAAGVGSPRRPIWELESADFRACFDVNVLGVMLALRAVMPLMIEQKFGRVVAIGGTYGHKGVGLASLYASSKWAVRGLIRSVALEGGPHGVTANVVAPGGIEGPRLTREFQASAERDGLTYEAVLERFTRRSALNRLVTPDEVCAAVVHLASDAGRNITGQDLIVDAGQII
ncbi:MAG TPA: SDR family oxidoreductase [Caulobacteraceae bacterium]|nr:SDR family oxidoreductase [Caulobacteraceae bacterium]